MHNRFIFVYYNCTIFVVVEAAYRECVDNILVRNNFETMFLNGILLNWICDQRRSRDRGRSRGSEEAGHINEPINGRVTSPAFPTTRLSVDFSDTRGRASYLLAMSCSLTEFICEAISYLKALLNANKIGISFERIGVISHVIINANPAILCHTCDRIRVID